MATVFQRDVFQFGVFQIDPLPSAGGGDRITGGTFSRKRWRDLKAAQLEARRAIERARKRIEAQAKEAARQKAAAERAAVILRRAVEDEASRQAAIDRMLQAAQQFRVPQLPRMPIVPPMVDQDEEEALMLLLADE